MCDERSTSFIDHSVNIKAATHLNENKLQLNKLGKITFDWNMWFLINYDYYQVNNSNNDENLE